MSNPDFSAVAARHRNYFRSGATRPVEWRERQLTALRAMMTDRAEDFYAALWTDFRRNRTDADLTDVKHLAVGAALGRVRGRRDPRTSFVAFAAGGAKAPWRGRGNCGC